MTDDQNEIRFPTMHLLGAELERLFEAGVRDQRQARPRARTLVEVGLGGLVVAGVAAALIFSGSDQPLGTQPASAAEVLRDAAVAERTDAPPPPGPGEYQYTKSEEAYLTIETPPMRTPPTVDDYYAYLEPKTRETWFAPNGGGRLRETAGPASFLSQEDKDAAAANDQRLPTPGEVTVTPLPAREASDYPTDPEQLVKVLKEEAESRYPGGYTDIEIFNDIGIALHLPQSSAQRAALFEVASRLDGIELIGEVTDPEGRTGVAVAMNDPKAGIRHTMIFDPETSELLAEEDVVSAPNEKDFAASRYPVGTVIGSSTYLGRGIVDSRDAVPEG